MPGEEGLSLRQKDAPPSPALPRPPFHPLTPATPPAAIPAQTPLPAHGILPAVPRSHARHPHREPSGHPHRIRITDARTKTALLPCHVKTTATTGLRQPVCRSGFPDGQTCKHVRKGNRDAGEEGHPFSKRAAPSSLTQGMLPAVTAVFAAQRTGHESLPPASLQRGPVAEVACAPVRRLPDPYRRKKTRRGRQPGHQRHGAGRPRKGRFCRLP